MRSRVNDGDPVDQSCGCVIPAAVVSSDECNSCAAYRPAGDGKRRVKSGGDDRHDAVGGKGNSRPRFRRISDRRGGYSGIRRGYANCMRVVNIVVGDVYVPASPRINSKRKCLIVNCAASDTD